ncbi:hypothetical protein PILCRDRAFT_823686, partial [Piloderma croceum F 1598]
MAGLSDLPENYLDHVRRATAAIIMQITYGHEVGPLGDNYVKLADEALESFSTASEPGAFLVDFPGAGFKRKAMVWHKLS